MKKLNLGKYGAVIYYNDPGNCKHCFISGVNFLNEEHFRNLKNKLNTKLIFSCIFTASIGYTNAKKVFTVINESIIPVGYNGKDQILVTFFIGSKNYLFYNEYKKRVDTYIKNKNTKKIKELKSRIKKSEFSLKKAQAYKTKRGLKNYLAKYDLLV